MIFVHFPTSSVCAVRPNASIQTASMRSAGHLFGVVVGCREEVENKCNDGIQLRISFTEHEENDVDDEGILWLWTRDYTIQSKDGRYFSPKMMCLDKEWPDTNQ